jgi:hypothetical protein
MGAAMLTVFGVFAGVALLAGTAAQAAPDCNPVGNVQFICGRDSPEDLVVVPGAEWVVASGNRAPGTLRLISVRDRSTTVVFPTGSPRLRPDTKTYNTCPGPIDLSTEEARAQVRFHGLYLKPGRNSIHTLYSVHHGTRESIEVFELDARTKAPSVTWIGCAVAPDPIYLNAVVALADGGFVATEFRPRNASVAQLLAGEVHGELWEWHTATGWKLVPGAESGGPNGLEISKDNKRFFIGAFASQELVRVSRGQAQVKRDSVPMGFRVDNVRWAPDGSLLVAGVTATAGPSQSSIVVRMDPETLRFQELVLRPNSDAFRGGTVAVEIGKEIWLAGTDRIAISPVAGSPKQ